MNNSNPLLNKFDTVPFSLIKNEHFKPAFQEAIKTAQREIDFITNNNENPIFENTIGALDFGGEQLNRISSVLFNLNSAETSDEIQKITREISPWLTKFRNDLTLNQPLFKKVQEVYNQRTNLSLTEEQKTLLEKHYRAFTRNGANLEEDKKEKLRELDTELARLSLQFGENVLADTNAYELNITNEADLDGLPQSAKTAAAELAKAKNKEGYVFTLQYPSYLPFMKYVKNRKLRKTLAMAYGARGFQKNQYNNEENVLKIATLRYERARLLGFDTHAQFVLERRMAKSSDKVKAFLNDLLTRAKPAAEREFSELSAFAKETDGIDRLEKWDSAYYSEKLRQRLFDFDDEQLRPYFQLENVLNGIFTVAGKLYGLQFTEVHDIDKYHEEVRTFRVTDKDNKYIALLYTDFFPREGKRNGAWMTSFKEQEIRDGENGRPQVSIVCNFSRPTESDPSLLTFQEVTTLFHEFGHSLHGMLANTTYPGLSGTNVFWDFVELPSQVMENWCYEKETLELFARHYKTGELIPMALIEKIRKAANFHEGMQTVRQISFGLLDMAWHDIDPTGINDVKEHEKKAFQPTRLFPDVAENCMSTSFSHIFQGGYSAGYYSYKWAEVLDADAFAHFKEKGIFNKDIATKFKDCILSKGGTEDPMILYRRFRGKEPSPDALLKRAGLME